MLAGVSTMATEFEVQKQSRLDSIMNLIPDQLKTPFAVMSATGVAFTGALAVGLRSNLAFAQGAPSGEITSTPASSSGGSDECVVPEDKSKPYDSCWDPANDTNVQVSLCQDMATNKPANHVDMIASRKIHFKKGSSRVVVAEGINRLQVWIGPEFLYSCSEVTKNYVKLQLIQNAKASAHLHSKDARVIGKASVAHGDDSTKFDGIFGKVVIRKKALTLPHPLTAADLRNHRFGVKDTIVSAPLIQKPYVNESDPSQNVPGPMKTVYGKPHITLLK